MPEMMRDNLLDSSNYPKSHPLFSETNRAKLGCIKDEGKGNRFTEWILLRPKCYSMQYEGGTESKRAKGVRQATVKQTIKHTHYRDAYFMQKVFSFDQSRINSRLHHMHTLKYNKKSLSFFDDKRCWTDLNVSYPFGFYALPTHINSRVEKRSIQNVPSRLDINEDEPPCKRICK